MTKSETAMTRALELFDGFAADLVRDYVAALLAEGFDTEAIAIAAANYQMILAADRARLMPDLKLKLMAYCSDPSSLPTHSLPQPRGGH